MKKLTLGFAAAALLGFASLAAPASASPAPTNGASSQQTTDFSSQRRFHRHHGFRRGPVCTTRITRTRGPMGRVYVRKVRVCR